MCGISAIIDFPHTSSLPTDVLQMHRSIPHRGPDGEGFLGVGGQYQVVTARSTTAFEALRAAGPWCLGLGFRWLKIQDLTEPAAQPMGTADEAVWVMLNGEIYNFKALRTELQGQGYRFRTASDTEVVLAAYQAWGTACFCRFHGMWAIVIVDLRQRKVVLSRDRFGIKPLFYASNKHRLYLASEIKQIVAVAGSRPQAHRQRVVDFLCGQRTEPGEATFYADIWAVPAATYAEVSLTATWPQMLTFRPYWRLADFYCVAEEAAPSFPEACVQFEQLLSDAVASHSTAAVPLGSLLSGGLDSSVLTALLARRTLHPETRHPSFSLVFPGAGALDESPYSAAVARRSGVPNWTTTLQPAWVHAHVPQMTWSQEEPLYGPAVVAQYRVYQLAAEHGMRVILDGQGADEILAGYPRQQHVLLQDWLRRRQWRKLSQAVMGHWRTEPGFLMQVLRQLALASLRGLLHDHLPGKRAVPHWLSQEARHLRLTAVSLDTQAEQSQDTSRLNRLLYTDVQSGNLKAVLLVGDRNSMAHSIEARVPYLDHRLVEFVFQLPDAYKAGSGLRKRLLQTVARTYLPENVLQRRDRIGFGVPSQAWLQGACREGLAEALHSSALRTCDLFEWSRLNAWVDGFYAGRHRDAMSLWRLYALWQWVACYDVVLA